MSYKNGFGFKYNAALGHYRIGKNIDQYLKLWDFKMLISITQIHKYIFPQMQLNICQYINLNSIHGPV